MQAWAGEFLGPEWEQVRRLAGTPTALEHLRASLGREPALAGRLVNIVPAPMKSGGALFFAARWRDERGSSGEPGTPVLVKVRCGADEVFWLSALSARSASV